jgi:hypothetical protein
MFCIKTYVFIVSGTIQAVQLPSSSDTSNTFQGADALVSGYGLTSEGKCVDPFNSYSTDKG